MHHLRTVAIVATLVTGCVASPSARRASAPQEPTPPARSDPAPQAAATTPVDRHVATAEKLVAGLDLANTSYEHGHGTVSWAAPLASHTDCSGFIDHLLVHDDGFTANDFQRWFGKARPTAASYHDAVVAEKGFTQVRAVGDLRPGDLIAIKYLTRKDNTGHVMLVVEAPKRIPAGQPVVAGTEQWSVTVIDSSESGHGTTDTRHKKGEGGGDHDGLGRGVFRIYSDARDGVAGFSWSTLKASHFVAPEDEVLALGRLKPGFHP
jgi:cell wall-associated NlpC family hydrolase